MDYRREIDGLRAVSVIAVVLFHAGFSFISGGYTGVDLFFVISGYLITSILLEAVEKQKFSFINFYERRARRILPALFFVFFFCCVFAWVFLPPAEMNFFAKSLVASALFSSNIFFSHNVGYFSFAVDEMPLLHTWSLAIEEQFYIFYPLLFFLLWRLGRQWLVATLLIILLVSFYFAESYGTNAPGNFFLAQYRIWELALGCYLAFVPISWAGNHKPLLKSLGALGMAGILYSFLMFDQTTPYPGIYTLIPVVSIAILLLCLREDDFFYRVLTLKPVVFIGLISYSLYLWHQPLLAFLRLKTVGEPSLAATVVVLVVVLILSIVSWRYVERPFRSRANFSQATILASSVIGLLLFFTFGLYVYLGKGLPDRFVENDLENTAISSPLRDNCHTSGADYLHPENACRYYAENVRWAVFGDSHVAELGLALAEKLKINNQGILHLSFSDCPPAILFRTNLPGCSDWLEEALALLESDDSISNVVLGFRHSFYLFGNHADSYPVMPSLDARRIFADSAIDSAVAAQLLYWESFKNIIDRLLLAGKNVYLLFPVPEIPMNIHKGIYPFSIFSSDPLLDVNKSSSMSYYLQRNKFILGKLKQLDYSANLKAIKPDNTLCSQGYCRAVFSGKTLYFDDDHLSIDGARLIVDGFL